MRVSFKVGVGGRERGQVVGEKSASGVCFWKNHTENDFSGNTHFATPAQKITFGASVGVCEERGHPRDDKEE